MNVVRSHQFLCNFFFTKGAPPTTKPPPTTTLPPTTAPPTCQPPKIPVACQTQCPKQCHFLGKCTAVTASPTCIPGCQCPNGTVSDGVTCRPPSQCLCQDTHGNIRQVKRRLNCTEGCTFTELFYLKYMLKLII